MLHRKAQLNRELCRKAEQCRRKAELYECSMQYLREVQLSMVKTGRGLEKRLAKHFKACTPRVKSSPPPLWGPMDLQHELGIPMKYIDWTPAITERERLAASLLHPRQDRPATLEALYEALPDAG